VEEIDKPAGEADQLVFERSDFEELLNPEGAQPASLEQTDAPDKIESAVALSSESAAPVGSWGTHAESPYDVERLHPPTASPAPPEVAIRPPGILLSPTRATVLLVAGIAAIALAFAAGLLTGFYWQPTQQRQSIPEGDRHGSSHSSQTAEETNRRSDEEYAATAGEQSLISTALPTGWPALGGRRAGLGHPVP
jgi:hypothetical protein